ncbi:hypothetical protein, partial [Rhizobium johnstonii]|uniref:hypothetical protein n=1 Tax=Rhizobium johnstonii TaxID=3019933 RepID=UPI003F9C92C2
MFGNPGLDLADACECLIPARFELRRYKSVLRIGRVILPECPVGSIACCLEVAKQDILNLIALAGHIAFRLDGGGNSSWFDHAEQRLLDRIIDPQTAEGDATWFAIVEQPSPTGIARDVMVGSCVTNRQLP